MVSVSPLALKALNAQNALDLFKGQQQSTKTAATAVAPSIESTSKGHLAIIAGLIDKLINIKSGGTGEDAAATASGEPTAEQRAAWRTAFEAAKASEDTARRGAIPADQKAKFDGLASGHDMTWLLDDKPKADAAAVAADIQTIRQWYASDTGSPDIAYYRALRQATVDGTLKIVPAENVPESGYETFEVTFYYADGSIGGGAGGGTSSREYWSEQRAQGIHASAASLGGRDYVTLWPVSAEEKEKGSWAA